METTGSFATFKLCMARLRTLDRGLLAKTALN